MEATLGSAHDVTPNGDASPRRDMRLHTSTVRIALTALVVLAFSFTFAMTTAWGERMDQLAAKASNSIFKTLDLETLDGGRFTIDDINKARLTVFNVWGTDCPPCIKELPYLQKLNDSYAPGEVQVVGILSDSAKSDGTREEQHLVEAKGYMETSAATFPTLILDADAFAFVKTNVVGTPTTFFVNSEGDIVRTVAGGNSYEDWVAIVDEELAKLS